NRAKTEFLSRTSHELRTPLNAILGFAQLLETDLGDTRHRRNASQIVRAGRHLLALIDDVLDIARIEAGGPVIEHEPVELDPLLAEALALVSPLAAKRQIRLQGPAPAGPTLVISADRQRALQVVLNLLSNAIKYNIDGGWVRIDTARDDATVTIDVTDGGKGISPELRERLFTPFDRLGAERHDRNGTGLGLALSKSLMTQMGGAIAYEPGAHGGGTFRLSFVRAANEAPRHGDILAPASAGGPGAGTNERTVLCVENDASNLALIETLMLRRPNLRLVTARDGSQALLHLQETPPDLVLLDLNLPGLSGEAVLQKIRAYAAPAPPVVILSADAMPETIERLKAAGTAAYLTKPLDLKAFYATLDGALT
ncbi:MAG TPA: ATP-binding protein, partial [Paraburkholderia sp.]|nr:ATP-binding protein [Paraburkholderia sp.]